jgi:phosphate transport system substrate-binding protein
MRSHSASIFVALLSVAASLGHAIAADAVRVGGTGTAIGFLQHAAAKFAADSGGKVMVIPALGSTGSLRALSDGKIEVAVAARPLKSEEAAAGLRQVLALRTAYVMATSRRAGGDLKAADVAKIYGANSPIWPDGTPVHIILRPRSDTDTELLGAIFPGMADALEAARRRPDVPTAATDQDNADEAERLTGSLAGTTATQIKTEGRRLQTMSIDGVEPTLANFESGAYPYAKKLYVVVKGEANQDVARFVEFLHSPSGLALLRDAEVLPEAK